MKKYFILRILFGWICSVISFAQSFKTEEVIKQMEAAGKLKRMGNTLELTVDKLSDIVQARKKYHIPSQLIGHANYYTINIFS
jgi:hypothetical protein